MMPRKTKANVQHNIFVHCRPLMSDAKGRGDSAAITDIHFNQHFGTLISAVRTARLADQNKNPSWAQAISSVPHLQGYSMQK